MRLHLVKNCWFRSSVGLEQQPSKLWVLGSNPNGITYRTFCITSDNTANCLI